MARKTIDIETLRISANRGLMAEAGDVVKERMLPAYRLGIIAVLETALMETGNYKGFRFTDGNSGLDDHTRRVYY